MKTTVMESALTHDSLSKVLVFVLALLATGSAFAGKNMSADELTSFVQGYYLHPNPERIADAIDALGPSGYVQNNSWGFVSFFSEVFAANPDRLPGWKKRIARQDKPVREFLQRSLDLVASGGTLALTGHSTGLNDMYWGAFFASGNRDYLGRLIDELRYFDEREDQDLFLAGATAKWSLLSNAEMHPLVVETLKNARADADTRTREIIETMLLQSAADVRAEIKTISDQQKAVGSWK